MSNPYLAIASVYDSTFTLVESMYSQTYQLELPLLCCRIMLDFNFGTNTTKNVLLLTGLLDVNLKPQRKPSLSKPQLYCNVFSKFNIG